MVRRLAKIKEWIDGREKGAILIPFSAEFELKAAELKGDALAAFYKEKEAIR